MEWYNMTYDEINEIDDMITKSIYREKYRLSLINFVNPLYDNLTSKEQRVYDQFDYDNLKPMYLKIQKLKELLGEDRAKQIVKRRIHR